MPEEYYVSAEALKECMHRNQPLFFVELRHPDDRYHEEHEWSLYKVRGGLLIQSDTVERHLSEMPKDVPVVLVSDSPGDSISFEAAELLRKNGWNNYQVLEGGFKAYLEEGLPVEPIKNIMSATKVMNL